MRSFRAHLTALACWGILPQLLCVSAETGTRATPARTAELFAGAGGFPGGICVVLGRTDAQLALSLAKHGRFVVHALYDDQTCLDQARRVICNHGVYGTLSAGLGQADRLPYAENLVNVIVADSCPKLESQGFSIAEVLRVLAPLGVAFFGDSGGSPDSNPAWLARLKTELEDAGFEDIELVRENGPWLKAKKPLLTEKSCNKV